MHTAQHERGKGSNRGRRPHQTLAAGRNTVPSSQRAPASEPSCSCLATRLPVCCIGRVAWQVLAALTHHRVAGLHLWRRNLRADQEQLLAILRIQDHVVGQPVRYHPVVVWHRSRALPPLATAGPAGVLVLSFKPGRGHTREPIGQLECSPYLRLFSFVGSTKEIY